MNKSKSVKLSAIHIDGGTQTRAAINETTVAEYAEDMQAGHKFPPVIVFNDGADQWMADGFHRYHAAGRCEFKDILAEVRAGTRRDAVRYALSANLDNGLRRTNLDKRRCVEIALKEFPDKSDRAIAEMCGVSHPFVAQVRPVQVETVTTSPSSRTGIDGKSYPAPAPSPVAGTGRITPITPTSSPALDAIAEAAEKDSETLWHLKGYWKKATKKDRAAFRDFIQTTNENQDRNHHARHRPRDAQDEQSKPTNPPAAR